MVGILLAQRELDVRTEKASPLIEYPDFAYFTYSIYLEQNILVYLDGSIPATPATDQCHEGGASSYI